MNRRFRVIVATAVLLVVGLGGWLAYREYERRRALAFLEAFLSIPNEKPSWRGYLPATATDVREWAWADSFLPDYSYLLKAGITEDEFNKLVAQLGLTPHTSDRKYSEDSHWLAWSAGPRFDGKWWDASPRLDSTYVREGYDTWTFAKYESNFLYFKSLKH